MLDISITADNWYYLAIAVVIITVGIVAFAVWTQFSPNQSDEVQDIKTAVDGLSTADTATRRKGGTDEVKTAFSQASAWFASFINSRTNPPTPPSAPTPVQGQQPAPASTVININITAPPGTKVETDQKPPEGES